MIDGVTIALHMYMDDCPTVLMFFQCYYPTIMLEYPVVVDHNFLSLYCIQKYCEHVRYFDDRGSKK